MFKLLYINGVNMNYRVHKFDMRMTKDQDKLEQFLNQLTGEVIAIIPNVVHMPAVHVNFVLIVEKNGLNRGPPLLR